MGNPIKKALFDYQLNKRHRVYDKKVKRLGDPYNQWIRENESLCGGEKYDGTQKPDIQYFSVEDICARIERKQLSIDNRWLGVIVSDGQVATFSKTAARELSERENQIGLVYGDEDLYDPDKEGEEARYGAWFKPDESPETLLSFFYYGSVVLCNVQVIKEALHTFEPVYTLKQYTPRQFFYDFMLYYTDFVKQRGLEIYHMTEIIFHGKGAGKATEDLRKPEPVNVNAYWGFEPAYDACKLAAIAGRGHTGEIKHYIHSGREYAAVVYPTTNKSVSIIIPSKDNIEMLRVCIQSLKAHTAQPGYEIIVVDNGSSEANKNCLESMSREYDFCYLYEPMEFHFSKMCNLGAKVAKGEFYLFLNDDIEVISDDWLKVLAGQAACDGIGAVGAKLLYPDSDLIQHVGISNIQVGPVHKLQKAHDTERDYYYGRNTLPYNVIGVTAACLLVKRDRFWQTGGFPAEAAVAYNDVELCFCLHELGYRNVVRNDVVLYHHESVSRGDDRMDDVKWNRLLQEKAGVYQRHPDYAKKDPYYNPNLTGFKPQYFCSYRYPYERTDCFSSVTKFTGRIKEEWHNDCLTVTLEHARLERKTELSGQKDSYLVEGWSYVLNMNNSRYERSLLLIAGDSQMYEADIWDRYRPDVVEILGEQECIALSGFACRLQRNDLPCGRYRIALLYRDCCSRQRLYRECEEILYIE